MKNIASLVTFIPLALILSGCLAHTPPGGNAVVDSPRQIGSASGRGIYELTCNRTNTTRCMLAAQQVCPSGFDILEQHSRGGFINGAPAGLIEGTFQCRP